MKSHLQMTVRQVQLFRFIISSVILVSFVNCTQATLHAEDLFPDKNLEAVVRQEVFEKRNGKEPLVAKDVENVSQIKGIGKSIKNLKGLEACISLRSIRLDNNEIVDLAPIKDLNLLQQLILKQNKIVDVTPLKNLTKLQHLDLTKNQIEKIDSLSEFKNMKSFYVGGNKIADISVVTNYTKAWSLYIQDNPVTDLKPISGLKFIDTLDISRTQVSDLSPLAPLTNLKMILMHGCKVTDLKVLVEMAKKDAAGETRFSPFWNLYLKDCKLSDAAKTTQVKELQKLGARVHLK